MNLAENILVIVFIVVALIGAGFIAGLTYALHLHQQEQEDDRHLAQNR